MTLQEIEQLKSSLIDAVEITVKATVNGKIDKLQKSIDEQKINFLKHVEDDASTAKNLEAHMVSDAEWKAEDAKYKTEIAPVIKIGQQAIGTGKSAFWLATFFGAIGTFLVAIIGIIKWIATMK